MNRRGFLKHALAAIPAIAVAPAVAEALAPKRTIVLPPAGGWPTSRLSTYGVGGYPRSMQAFRGTYWDDVFEGPFASGMFTPSEATERYSRAMVASIVQTMERVQQRVMEDIYLEHR